MDSNFTESDWKAFRKYKDEMLEALVERINQKSISILRSPEKTHLDRYHELFKHVRDSDHLVAACFDDWRRSCFAIFALNLFAEELIPEDLWNQLSASTQDRLKVLRKLRDDG